MTETVSCVFKQEHKRIFWFVAGFAVFVLVVASIPNLLRSRSATEASFQDTREFDQRQAMSVQEGLTSMRNATAVTFLAPGAADRRMVRTSTIDLVVANPSVTSEKIRPLAEQMGGFLVASELHGDPDRSTGVLTIRIPAARLEEAQREIRKLSVRVDGEKVEAEDVTRQYVDDEARLRNLHAQEMQYLGILKQARTVKDTLEVSDKLDTVRGEIEQRQAEFSTLSKRVETVAITVSLRAQVEAQMFGLHWRPLYQLKIALRDGLDGIADYATTVMTVVFYLPTILLWLVTVLIAAAVVWKILRWARRTFFPTA
jgi:Domain of unknown function (DUF4349)